MEFLHYPYGDLYLKDVIETNQNYEELSYEDEYFNLDNTSLESSKGRKPINDTIHFEPSKISINGIEKYDNPEIKFTNEGIIGFFQDYYNYINSPEDLTTSDWTQSSSTSTLTNFTFNDSKFTEVNATANDGNTYFTLTQPANSTIKDIALLTFVAKKGTGANALVMLYDQTSLFEETTVNIEWSTKTVTLGGAARANEILIKENWYGDEIVEISFFSYVNSSNVYYYRFYGNGSSTGTTYFTRIGYYATEETIPYKQGQNANKLSYSFEWPTQGTIEFWMKPQFSYDTSIFPYILNDRIIDDYSFQLNYNPNTDKFALTISDDNGTTGDSIEFGSNGTTWDTTNAFTSNTDLWKWHYIKITYNHSTQSYNVYAATEGDDFLTTIGSITTSNVNTTPISNNFLAIGYNEGATNREFNGYITDFNFKNYIDSSETHFLNNVPYLKPDTFIGKENNFSIDKYGNAYFNRLSTSAGPLGGTIIESGKNINGHYIKYSNGIMICWGTYTQIVAINTVGFYGGYRNLGGNYIITFPNKFISAPYGYGNLYSEDAMSCTTHTVTTETLGFLLWNINSSSAGNRTINWKAIGYWK